MTHVFVVDETTFKYHLEYKFAGTGAGDKKAPFLLSPTDTTCKVTTERMLVGMIADISRIRIGDNIIFYLQSSQGAPGTFFGVFKVVSEPFFDENDQNNYLLNELHKGLSFRVLIDGNRVFSKGITEHEYLDSLKGKNHPSDLCWSLIYRKLKGNRGCTMIMDYEFNDLLKKLENKNNGQVINSDNFTFNCSTKQIVANDTEHSYDGVKNPIDITNRLLYKFHRHNAFESHLQAYLTANFDKAPYKNLLLPLSDQTAWIGNEVSCGVGMQRIDIMLKQETQTDVYIKVIELKDEPPYRAIIDYQIPWYLEWLSDYVLPKYIDKTIHVIPTVIAKGDIPAALVSHFQNFNFNIQSASVSPLEYLGFDVDANNNIIITKYKYL